MNAKSEYGSSSAVELQLIQQSAAGDSSAFARIVGQFQREIKQFVDHRIDARIRQRIDASDIVQQTFVKAHRRMKDFAERRPMPLRTWLLKTAMEQLRDERVKHLNRERRTAQLEVGLPDQTSVVLARRLATQTTASEIVMKREQQQTVAQMIDRIGSADREILLLRHVDELKFDEIGAILEINGATARKRYARAVVRLRGMCVQNQAEGELE